MTNIQDKAHRADADTRKTYAAPQLEVFGEVAALTAAGSGSVREGKGDMSTTKNPRA
jgi:hypothetical protein